jgi:hypothetical protein
VTRTIAETLSARGASNLFNCSILFFRSIEVSSLRWSIAHRSVAHKHRQRIRRRYAQETAGRHVVDLHTARIATSAVHLLLAFSDTLLSFPRHCAPLSQHASSAPHCSENGWSSGESLDWCEDDRWEPRTGGKWISSKIPANEKHAVALIVRCVIDFFCSARSHSQLRAEPFMPLYQ